MPDADEIVRLMADRPINGGYPDRRRWGDLSSYQPEWAQRAAVAAAQIPDGARLFEIGAGAGDFRRLVEDRCQYSGADLVPLSPDILTLNLDEDPLPGGPYDYAVALGVAEYLHRPERAIANICQAARRVLISYCTVHPEMAVETTRQARRARGWVNAFTHDEVVRLFAANGCRLIGEQPVSEAEDFRQSLMLFARD